MQKYPQRSPWKFQVELPNSQYPSRLSKAKSTFSSLDKIPALNMSKKLQRGHWQKTSLRTSRDSQDLVSGSGKNQELQSYDSYLFNVPSMCNQVRYKKQMILDQIQRNYSIMKQESSSFLRSCSDYRSGTYKTERVTQSSRQLDLNAIKHLRLAESSEFMRQLSQRKIKDKRGKEHFADLLLLGRQRSQKLKQSQDIGNLEKVLGRRGDSGQNGIRYGDFPQFKKVFDQITQLPLTQRKKVIKQRKFLGNAYYGIKALSPLQQKGIKVKVGRELEDIIDS